MAQQGIESTCNAGDTGDIHLIPGLGRSPEGGHDNPLQSSCLENPMDRGAWQTAVHRVSRQTRQKRHSIHTMLWGFPGGASSKEMPASAGDRRHGFDPWVGKIPRRRAWQSILSFLPGESHG